MSYISRTDVEGSLSLNGTTAASADITRAVNAANAAIDEIFGRKFSQDSAASDRYYDVRRRHSEVLPVHDLTRATDPVVAIDADGDGVFETTLTENTDFVFEPLNAQADGRPFEEIAMISSFLPVGRRRVKVTATFGWPDVSVPAQIPAFAEMIAIKLVERFRSAPFGIVTAGAELGVAMRIARTDPDFPTLSAGLTRGVMIA